MPPYLQLVAERFDKDADTQIAEFLQRIDATPPPPRLFHYTDANGLSGITASGKLWLSDVFTLNDPSEITYALQAAVRITREQINSEEMRILSDQLEGFTSIDAAKAIANYFAFSFSSNGDDLNQWRIYADDGRGFALEFDATELENAFAKLNGVPIANNSTFPVNYNEEALRALVQKLLDLLAQKIAFVRKVMPSSKEAYGAYMSDLLLTMALHLYRLSLFFKHPAYQPEGEYRFLSLFSITDSVSDLMSRFRKDVPVRYREFDWCSMAPKSLKGIRIGPASDIEASEALVKECLVNMGLDVPILRSTIPYRALNAAKDFAA